MLSRPMATSSSLPPLDPLLRRSAKRTRDIFSTCPDEGLKDEEKRCAMTVCLTLKTFLFDDFFYSFLSARIRLSVKIHDEYKDFKELPAALLSQQGPVGPARPKQHQKAITAGRKSTASSCFKSSN